MSVRWREDRKRWMIDIEYQLANGETVRVRKLRQTKKGAEKLHREIMHSLETGTWKTKEESEREKQTELTFSEFAHFFMNTYSRVENKPSEQNSKEGILRRYLLPILGEYKLKEIDESSIADLKSEMIVERGLSKKTVNNTLAVLSKMLRWACDERRLLATVPKIRLYKAEDPPFDFLTFKETNRFLDAAKEHVEAFQKRNPTEPRPDWLEGLTFLFRTGLRAGEWCELRWYDLHLDAGNVHVSRSWYGGQVTTPKSGKTRDVPLTRDLVSMLEAMRQSKMPGPHDLVFCQSNGARHTERKINKLIKRICKRGDLRSFSPHVARHTFASHLVMLGVPLRLIQEFLGHYSVKQTERYAHLAPSVKKDAIAVLDSVQQSDGLESEIGTPAKSVWSQPLVEVEHGQLGCESDSPGEETIETSETTTELNVVDFLQFKNRRSLG